MLIFFILILINVGCFLFTIYYPAWRVGKSNERRRLKEDILRWRYFRRGVINIAQTPSEIDFFIKLFGEDHSRTEP